MGEVLETRPNVNLFGRWNLYAEVPAAPPPGVPMPAGATPADVPAAMGPDRDWLSRNQGAMPPARIELAHAV